MNQKDKNQKVKNDQKSNFFSRFFKFIFKFKNNEPDSVRDVIEELIEEQPKSENIIDEQERNTRHNNNIINTLEPKMFRLGRQRLGG